ncbi:phosphoribulokinase [Methylocaldum marinum]|uniref:phosphoribulokinase n=1 Tax=Methylocaldum marinum TaxID=1432792 RepID=A0A250KN05_9GAMM|nr:phosphoribulokinase [Methylocaldum marinum]BBA33090.1 phosphoribulokinase [Methylocaldum marinum]
MSKKHPVIAITGSSGAGTTTVKKSFEHIFFRLGLKPLMIEGNSFYRYNSIEMQQRIARAQKAGKNFSHFSIEANLLEDLARTFKVYGETGSAKHRHYVRSDEDAKKLGYPVGTFTPWQKAPRGTDLLFYEGLHGAVRTETVNVAQYTDLLVGVVPIVNLEWIQKIHRDSALYGHKPEDITDIILRRMEDYVRVITPQFTHTDINFQRVPLVDTSNPFMARDIPTADESVVIIRFKDPLRFDIDFEYLRAMLHKSFMSRHNSIVIPGGKMGLAMEVIFRPIIERMIEDRKKA